MSLAEVGSFQCELEASSWVCRGCGTRRCQGRSSSWARCRHFAFLIAYSGPEQSQRNSCLNPPCEYFIQSRVHPRRLSAASTKSEESDGCLRVFFAK